MARSDALGLRTTKGRETVEFWKSQLQAAKRQWETGEVHREPIRTLISELRFPPLMYKSGGGSEPETRLGTVAAKKRFPHVDQIDLNLPLRYMQKLASSIGDESPEVRYTRDWTRPWEQHAKNFDIFVERMMQKAGAPENNADGARDVCSDGITTYWLNFTYNLSADDLYKATESVDLVIERILADPEAYQPAEGADHLLMAEVLEGRALDFQTGVKDPTGLVANALLLASTKHYQAAAKDEKNTWRWRSDRLRLEHERLPYGTHALMDPSATSFRYARWVARLIRMPLKDARQHPAFHPSIRKDLNHDEISDPALRRSLEYAASTRMTDQPEGKEWTGLCSIWEIHDRKNKEILYLNHGIDRFLNAGMRNGVSRMRHPFLDDKGRELIPPMGPHPGFFPCDFCVPQPPKRDNEQKKFGNPLLQPGLKIVYALVKAVSHYMQTVKRASSALYEAHPKLNDTARRAIKAGVDGTIFTRPADVPPGESVIPLQWKPPSEQLFRQVSELISQWCMVQSFPLAELTTQPVADTVGQEEIGIMAGDAWMSEVVRKFELSYSVQCHIAMHLAMTFTKRDDWAELIGLNDGNTLHQLVSKIRFPPVLPAIRFSPYRRGAEPIRIRQLMDLDERLATDLDPIMQIPKWDRDQVLQEIARTLDVGRIPRYIPEKDQLELIAEAKARILAEAELEEGAGSPSGAPPSRVKGPSNGQSQPVDRPAEGGSPGGSASNSRSSASARRSRRGGRRGRTGGTTTVSNEYSATGDAGV